MNNTEIITAAIAFWMFISEKENINLNDTISAELSAYIAENPLV